MYTARTTSFPVGPSLAITSAAPLGLASAHHTPDRPDRQGLLRLPPGDHNLFQNHILHRAVAGAAGNAANRHQHVLSFHDLPEHRVTVVQMQGGDVSDEELAPPAKPLCTVSSYASAAVKFFSPSVS